MRKNASDAALRELINALQPLRRVWVQCAGIALAEFGLPISFAATLILVARQGSQGIRQNILAEEVGLNPSGMVRILDQAAEAELLERRDSPDDRRVKTVHALPKGRELAKNMDEAVTRLRSAVVGDLPPDEVETAARVLRQFESRAVEFLRQERSPK